MKTLILAALVTVALASPAKAEFVGKAPAKAGEETIQVLTNTFLQTAYVFDPDQGAPGKSVCNGRCAEVWPPLTVTAEEAAEIAADQVKHVGLSVITRDNGLNQLAFQGRPIYLFHLDRAVGDTKGDGVGGVWHLVRLD